MIGKGGAIDPRWGRFRRPVRARDECGSGAYLKSFTAILLVLIVVNLTSCAALSRHEYVAPTHDWTARSGQLLYRTPKSTLMGEVFVRFSKTGDFELTFSKGPGVTLFVLRQDASFAEVRGAMAGPGWAGPVDQAPKRLRPWLGLRDQLIRSQNQQSVRYVAGSETFLFRF
jgi:hypothetical protein